MSEIVVSVSDPAGLPALRRRLDGVPSVRVTQLPGSPEPGHQGVWDVLQVIATSGGVLAVAVRTLPDFIRSRRSSVSVSVTTGDRTFTMTADNVAEVLPVIERALRDG